MAKHGGSFGSLFKGLSELVERLGELSERAGELSKSGEMTDADGKVKGVYGFSVKMGVGEQGGMSVEPFGNIRKDSMTGKAEVAEIREPMVDVFEEEDHLLVVAEMPGIGERDLRLEVSGDILSLAAEVRDRKYRKEVLLPRAVSADAPNVSCNNGVVEIRLR